MCLLAKLNFHIYKSKPALKSQCGTYKLNTAAG